jgi:hypothetical protein
LVDVEVEAEFLVDVDQPPGALELVEDDRAGQ